MDTQVIKRFAKRKSSIVGGVVIIFFLLMALFGPFFTPYDPLKQDLTNNYQNPNWKHWLGTDGLGRDILTRLIYGSRISFEISFISVALGVLVGTFFGVVAGYYGRWIDSVIMRLVDLMLAFPGMLLAIVLVTMLGTGLFNTMMAIAIWSVPYFARVVRAQVISLREVDFIQACRAVGASNTRIIIRHVIPNALSQIIVLATLRLGAAILIASGLSFLGLGVQPPNPEWGAMLSKARSLLRTIPIAAISPGVAITLVVLSFSLVGDGLRDALDPKLKD